MTSPYKDALTPPTGPPPPRCDVHGVVQLTAARGRVVALEQLTEVRLH